MVFQIACLIPLKAEHLNNHGCNPWRLITNKPATLEVLNILYNKHNFKLKNIIYLYRINNIPMSTYTQLLYQIVFSTKNRKKVLIKENREELYKYIWGILKHKNCHLYQINSVEDHIHNYYPYSSYNCSSQFN